jgi:hypothetical protein
VQIVYLFETKSALKGGEEVAPPVQTLDSFEAKLTLEERGVKKLHPPCKHCTPRANSISFRDKINFQDFPTGADIIVLYYLSANSINGLDTESHWRIALLTHFYIHFFLYGNFDPE